jgi:N-acyl-D-aspartate/D-glutamate deacylase
MPDLDLIKQEEQGVRDRPGRFARGRSGNPAGRPRGFHDRGRLMPGKRADLNLVDFDRLCLRALEVVNDLPAGGKRLVQRAEGYTATSLPAPRSSSMASTPAPGRLVRRGR